MIFQIFPDNLNKTKGGFLFGKVVFDYFVSNRTTISASVIRVHGKFKPGETIDIRTDSLLQGETISRLSERISQSSREFNALGFQGGIKHNFKRQGEEWTADFNMFNGKNEGDGLYTTNYYNSDKTIAGTQIQQNLGDGKMGFMTIQTDYVRPFTGSTKLETGLRAQINNTENNNENFIKYPGATDYIKLSNATTNYKNTSSVYAAYVSFASSIKSNFGYKIGLRAESSNYKGDLLNTGQKFKNNYPISLFPSLFLSQNW